jgi:phosphoribosyl-AMP cyclohydrolase
LTLHDAGLIPAIAQDHATGEVLMLAWMNAEACADAGTGA